jgi:hypothetical protein
MAMIEAGGRVLILKRAWPAAHRASGMTMILTFFATAL